MINGHDDSHDEYNDSAFAKRHDALVARIQHFYEYLKTRKRQHDPDLEEYECLFEDTLFMEF